jgi:uncharacterized protein (TIGR01777 family)
MKIVVSGGTGFIGRRVVRALRAGDHELVVMTRHPERYAPERGLTYAGWDGSSPPVSVMMGAGAVIHMAGEPLAGGRWTRNRKERILSSRTVSTAAIVAAIRAAKSPPGVLLSMSAVGFYGDAGRAMLTEEDGPGEGFLARVCAAWEEAALRARDLDVRVVLPRMGLVLGRGGGALAGMAVPFRLFLGGPLGPGTQCFPWIHVDDAVGALLFALAMEGVRGPVNVVAPEIPTMREFAHALGRALHRPSRLAVPAFLLRAVLGEMAVMVLGSQCVAPAVLTQNGYHFAYPSLGPALAALYAR